MAIRLQNQRWMTYMKVRQRTSSSRCVKSYRVNKGKTINCIWQLALCLPTVDKKWWERSAVTVHLRNLEYATKMENEKSQSKIREPQQKITYISPRQVSNPALLHNFRYLKAKMRYLLVPLLHRTSHSIAYPKLDGSMFLAFRTK